MRSLMMIHNDDNHDRTRIPQRPCGDKSDSMPDFLLTFASAHSDEGCKEASDMLAKAKYMCQVDESMPWVHDRDHAVSP